MSKTENTTVVSATAPAAIKPASKVAKVKAEKPAKAPKAEKAPKATKAAKPAVEKAPKEPSKKSVVVPVIVAAIAAGTARKDTLARLQSEFKMTASGANTYYQNVKAGTWK